MKFDRKFMKLYRNFRCFCPADRLLVRQLRDGVDRERGPQPGVAAQAEGAPERNEVEHGQRAPEARHAHDLAP